MFRAIKNPPVEMALIAVRVRWTPNASLFSAAVKAGICFCSQMIRSAVKHTINLLRLMAFLYHLL